MNPLVENEQITERAHQDELGNLVDELIKTEADFINDLRLCFKVYIEPLSRCFDVSNIFLNWDQLMQLHESALARISSSTISGCDRRTVEEYCFVFRVFQDLLASLDGIYVDICSRQRESTSNLECRLVSDIRFKQVVSDIQKNAAKQFEKQVSLESNDKPISRRYSLRALSSIKLPITSFLLKPMQRITKYDLHSSRIHKVILERGPKELEESAADLKVAAKRLCEKTNHACRLKEDEQQNSISLLWAQAHIKQNPMNMNQQLSPSLLDSGSLERRHSLMSTMSQDSLRKDSSLSTNNEFIVFNSRTNCLGERKFIKSGSFIKLSSGKELVLFLFNDLLLLTQVKGTSSMLKVQDVFQSQQAQQAYYKLYRQPILMEDVILLDQKMAANSSLYSNNKRASTPDSLAQLVVSFSDKSNGSVYNLVSLNAQEKTNWVKELGEKSIQAREARAEYQARQASLLFKPMLRKISVNDCIGRLFVTILEISRFHTGTRNSSVPSTSFALRRDHHSSLNLKVGGGLQELDSTTRMSIQLQLKRSRVYFNVDGSVKEKRDLIPISDIYSTKTVAITPSANFQPKNSYVPNEANCVIPIESLVRFSDESTQFLIKKKSLDEAENFLDIGMFDQGKFRETKLIARKRVNIDQLLQQQLQQPGDLLIKQSTQFDPMSAQFADRVNRPFECVFKMNSSGSRSSINCRQSYADERSIDGHTLTTRDSCRKSTGISVKIRFHLQLFCDNN